MSKMGNPDVIRDSWLVERYQSGHKNALTLLVKRWHIKFCKQAYWYTKDFDIAKDIAQESWNVIINKLDTLKEPDKFGIWGLSIVNRKSIDWIRKTKRTKEKLEYYKIGLDSGFEHEVATTNDYTSVVLRALHDLPDKQQIVLKLFYLESYSINEISKLLKVSKGTVKSRLFYAREKLKLIIKHKDHG